MHSTKLTALAGIIAFTLTGCGGESGSDSPTSTTPFTLSVTDAPVDDAKEVVITFGKVALLPQDGGSPLIYDVYLTDDEGNPVDENGELLPDGADTIPLSVNLLDYQGSASLPLIQDQVVLTGRYKLCVFANDGDHPTHRSYVVVDEDETPENHPGLSVKGDGACPQGVGKEDKAGVLYFNNTFNVNADSNDFAVEFDLRRGLKDASSAPDYTIQRTSVSLINTVTTGNIQGTVAADAFTACNTPEDSSAVQAVYLYDNTVTQENMAPIGGINVPKPITTAAVNWNQDQTAYEFSFGFIEPNRYNLGYTCTGQFDNGDENGDPVAAGFTIYKTSNDVAVTVGQDVQVTF
ncbi:DUF4382 domain-containing protein [Vibrio sp. 10N.222.51.C12]|uniref:DUF4382 domain-containing protein n=1 Tax=unclassified Vibrio TaxID=2614977 RepID=UPI000C84C2FE|nr:DUF4382 domain-containing protein [Vibrio sp. 10N.286.48.B7]PMH83254.1 hypothetical protein BCU58_01590 [Vibrio sp. 10N.286.48.B7]